MAQYDVVAVSRTPQSGAGPTLTELGPVYASGLSYEEVIDQPGGATMSINTQTLADDIKSRLRDLSTKPTEIWIYRDGTKVFAGPIIGGEMQGDDLVTLAVPGLLFYLDYMLVTTDKTFSAIEQFTIARELVDDWQDLTYGNFGIDVTAVTTSAITRTLTIPGAEEPVPVSEPIKALGAADDGFDIWVHPITRELELEYPTKGADKSTTIFLERGITSPKIRFSVAPGLIASEVYLTATSDTTALTSTAANATLRAAFGRCGFAVTADNVSNQTLADDLAIAYKDARAFPFFQPGPDLYPIVGAGVTDFDVGDTVTYSYDAGLGTQTGSYRIMRKKVSVADDGTESISVSFEQAA